MTFDGQKILVVGGAGFVGSNLCHKLLEGDIGCIHIVDNLLSAEFENIPMDNRVQFDKGSITDERVLKKIGVDFDYVFHLATFHGNQSSIHDPIKDHEHNTVTTLKLCEHFKNVSRLKKFIYSSAGCTVAEKTYDNTEATEENAQVSLYHDSPYQISKIIGEFYGNYYWMKHKLPFVKARFQNVYGPREILGAGEWRGTAATVWRNVTPTFIWKSLLKEALPLENRGKASRDFIYVEDIVVGLIACAKSGKHGDVYNLASGVETNIKTLAETINNLTENPTPIEYRGARDWDRSGKRFGATEKSKKELGFKANTTLEEGLQKTIAWTKKNQDLIIKTIKKHEQFMSQDLEKKV